MLTLQRPREELAASYLKFIEEMRRHGEKIWEGMIPKPDESTPQFVERLLRADISSVSDQASSLADVLPALARWEVKHLARDTTLS